ncbi:MAG: alpha/beta fold hydrolase [Verrucomicrobiales bacterium]|nr:alpha/beta fold hydrolase [Verrucomicrobiales bacterium]
MPIEWLPSPEDPEAYPVALLFVHGACHGGWCWQENFVPYFRHHHFRAHAFSLRGHGARKDTESVRWCSTNDYLQDLDEAVQRSGSRVILVGHSMGARLAQLYVARHPEAVKALILLAPPPPFGIVPSVARLFWRMPLAMLGNHLGLTWRYVSKREATARRAFFRPSIDAARLRRYIDAMGDEAAWAYFQMFSPLLPWEWRAKCPTLVIGGRKDQIFSAWELRCTKRTAKATGAAIRFAPHDLMLDESWERPAKIMVWWLKRKVLKAEGSDDGLARR